MLELPVLRETAIAYSQGDFSRNVMFNFLLFSQIRHCVAGPLTEVFHKHLLQSAIIYVFNSVSQWQPSVEGYAII